MFTLKEIIDILAMTFFVGFIFSDVFRKPRVIKDIVDYYKPKNRFNFEDIKFAALVTAPAIILHELGHKFVAMGFGMQATFNAAYTWLFVGAVLKLMNFGLIFFVPAYVAWVPTDFSLNNPWVGSVIAFAGPAVNLVLWLGTSLILKSKKLNRKYIHFLILTSRINMFLFIFNMIPIPGFDGFHVLKGLIETII
ncbi:M50 family metallopeptidase [Candidatus Woesearchaeota archaeon]|nr:M50 family metallopeptidase [Candidatus Woesearchaeota archaeon]